MDVGDYKMKKQLFVIAIISILIILGFTGCIENKDNSDVNLDSNITANETELLLNVKEKNISVNEDITFTLSLVNKGPDSLTIKPLEDIGSCYSPSIVHYSFTKPDGEVISWDPWCMAGCRNDFSDSDLIVLDSGENVSISRSTNICSENIFNISGDYTFHISYNSNHSENITIPFLSKEMSVEDVIYVT